MITLCSKLPHPHMPGPRDLNSILGERLAVLIARTRMLQALERTVRRNLSPELAGNCRVVNLREEELLLAAPSPVWATRLRYEVPRLRDALQRELGRLSTIRIMVLPETPEQPVKRPAVPLSPAASKTVEAAANSATDPALRAALARLARRR